MFSIESEKFGIFTKIIMINKDTGEMVTFIPEFGANILEMKLICNGQLYSILDGYHTLIELLEHRYFKNAKLSPFPNRIKNGVYQFNQCIYQLPINNIEENNAIHGFIWNKTFSVVDENILPDQVSITLKHRYNGSVAGYPFQFEINLIYTLHEKNGFYCTTRIYNYGIKTLPLGDGWHPYFTLDGDLSEYQVKIPAAEQIELDEFLIPTGNFKRIDDQGRNINLAEVTELDRGYRILPNGSYSVAEINNLRTGNRICIWQEAGKNKYNYFQLFIPPTKQSIAIEPMTCAPNAFNNLQGLIVLEAGDKFEASYGTYFKTTDK